jgi:hypothetical protein
MLVLHNCGMESMAKVNLIGSRRKSLESAVNVKNGKVRGGLTRGGRISYNGRTT